MRPHIFFATKAIGLILLLCTLALGCDEAGSSSISFSRTFGDALFEPNEAVIENRDGETMLRMIGVNFEAGSDNLTPASLPVLDKFAEVFDRMPAARISIEGHTDSAGAATFNAALSQDRADAVRDYLVNTLGAPPVVFSTVGYGETLPIANNATRAGRSENRRIEIIVQDDPGDAVFQVSLAAEFLSVDRDCDAFTSSPEAAAGDFYVQVEFYSEDDRGLVLADRSANTLVRLNDGESRELDIVAEERFIGSRDAVLTAFVDWFENDTGGAHQFDLIEETPRRYNARQGCWEDPRI